MAEVTGSGDSWQPVKGADPGRLKELGVLLRDRRVDLGYRHVPAFVRARGINTRMVGDIEHGRRDTYERPTLNDVAAAYEVTRDSMIAVVWSGAGELVPAPAGEDAPPPVVPVARPLPGAPMDDEGRESAVRPYATRIWNELLRLAAQGITSPSGVMLGLDPGDAGIWDGSAGAMSLADRAWLVADIQRRRDARASAAQAPATTA